MRRQWIVAGLGLLMFAGLCILENGMVAAKPKEPEGRSTSSVYMLAGEFRTVFANLLWIKADQYHHEFIERNKQWSQNTELIGLLEMITALDPHFVEAYSVCGALYSRGKHDNKKALAMLQEGISYNPKAWGLHRDAAIIYALHFHNIPAAQKHARLALEHCDDSFYVASLQRMVSTLERMEREESEKHKNSRKAERLPSKAP